jgi:hypothetical protein
VLVDFGLDASQNLVPDTASHVRACSCHLRTPAKPPSAPLSPLLDLVVTSRLLDRTPADRDKWPFSRPSPHENPCHYAIGVKERGENRGFSTFFSTVVENFGGRPYGPAGEATVAHDFNRDKANHSGPVRLD